MPVTRRKSRRGSLHRAVTISKGSERRRRWHRGTHPQHRGATRDNPTHNTDRGGGVSGDGGGGKGRGVWRCTNGDVYEGEYKAGLAEGRGVLRCANGDVYDGEYKAGKFRGARRLPVRQRRGGVGLLQAGCPRRRGRHVAGGRAAGEAAA
ncbi:hypothetical protein EMIHUDRAFT_78409 [Emiliania huxleyi CCMP1516]|uniref:MORN repeat protein n=2 Tax=Emiliania huxleyi TaxID=2903 RepID=A0A0D3JC87_EMIH1|nr:hypothetical protein EMIHUDRAFT_78409 [Emiliania huxleyi CCMP1516]EOD21122.1 hypothetical protein EMIHUDRAFT_78409 [Emiliania huxleyi CCMP1516]|eukprot:XP_005773551.1 hypothetical protein EMIHUDRAFT_78409 [Emiliania huxleyi CCMP1516]